MQECTSSEGPFHLNLLMYTACLGMCACEQAHNFHRDIIIIVIITWILGTWKHAQYKEIQETKRRQKKQNKENRNAGASHRGW